MEEIIGQFCVGTSALLMVRKIRALNPTNAGDVGQAASRNKTTNNRI
jgi:hypothetical protein